MRFLVLCFGWFVGSLVLAPAPGAETPFLNRLVEEEREAVRAVVMYPEEVRTRLFEASMHPGALARMDRLRDQTQVAFQQMLDPLDEDTAKKLWELARYPGLVSLLGGEKSPSDEALASALAEHPEAIHDVAREFAKRKKRKHVQELQNLNQQTAEAFDTVLSRYPEKTQQSLRALLAYPEILDILTRHIELTAELGDIYRLNPETVEAKANELQLQMARETAESDSSWSDAIGNDPRAVAELEASAADYAKENPRPEYVYSQPPPELSSSQVTVQVYAYPYWYGYPLWWGDPFWYPRPLWYHSGFYVSSSGAVIIIGSPSYHYTHWHLHVHRTHGHYVHLSGHYARHYDRHRHHRDAAADAMRDWERDNGTALRDRDQADREARGSRTGEGPRTSRDRQTTRSIETLNGGASARERARAGEFHQRNWGSRGAAGRRDSRRRPQGERQR